MARLPTLFISHGGGPWPYVDEMKTAFAKTAAWLTSLPAVIGSRPKAILSISGHWEEAVFTVCTAVKPGMIYDYGGFPEHTYHIQYPAPGSPEVAWRAQQLLRESDIPCGQDSTHGFDHGAFVPLTLMFPHADVPVVSLSLQRGYDPQTHLRAGRALAPLRDEGVLIMGSGLSYHNLRQFGRPEAGLVSSQFESWLTGTVELAAAARDERLVNWAHAPGARLAHPREDHLIPLMMAAGAAGQDRGQRAFVDQVWGVTMSSYLFR